MINRSFNIQYKRFCISKFNFHILNVLFLLKSLADTCASLIQRNKIFMRLLLLDSPYHSLFQHQIEEENCSYPLSCVNPSFL